MIADYAHAARLQERHESGRTYRADDEPCRWFSATREEREVMLARSEVRRLRLALDKARHNANAPWTRTYTRLLAAAEAKLGALA
jgi:predicted Fe-S protein YdhL (DUF1289 family)